MAGLYRQAEDGPHFVVLTTAANESMRSVHDRMPALLSREGAQTWLDSSDRSLLRPAPEDWLERRKVSARVNSIVNDDPQCQEPDTEPDGPDQLKLGLAW